MCAQPNVQAVRTMQFHTARGQLLPGGGSLLGQQGLSFLTRMSGLTTIEIVDYDYLPDFRSQLKAIARLNVEVLAQQMHSERPEAKIVARDSDGAWAFTLERLAS
jgi:hypothetical protein